MSVNVDGRLTKEMKIDFWGEPILIRVPAIACVILQSDVHLLGYDAAWML
jgi:hypothetical protein